MSDAPLPRSPRELVDQWFDVTLPTLTKYTPSSELDAQIAASPNFSPIRELHLLAPRLLCRTRDDELRDPFIALLRLADCLFNRVADEIQTRPVDREPLRKQMEEKLRELVPTAKPLPGPWEPWDARPQFSRHRSQCYEALRPALSLIGLEAKRLAAQAGTATEGQRVVDAVIACIDRLAEWSTSELSAGQISVNAAAAQFHEFQASEFISAVELLALFADSLDPRQPGGAQDLGEELLPDQFRFSNGRVADGLTAKQLKLLRLLNGKQGGIPAESLAKQMGYPPDDKGTRALGQLVLRTNDNLNDSGWVIEKVNGKFCLTTSASSA